jgi:heme oxygenase (biliverdin-producing, ferredoxin)
MTLTERLKAETFTDHDALEQTPILSRLASGRLSQQGYLEILKQLYLVHKKLEGLLEKHDKDARIMASYHPYHPRRDRALADIHYFEPDLRESQIKPNAGTRRLLDLFDSIEKRDPALLLGAFYVLEGSNFGAAFLVKVFQQSYGLSEAGVSYYLGHKHELKNRWDKFKEAINSIFATASEQNEIVAIARSTFQLFRELYLEIDDGEPKVKSASGNLS